jgi:hypothetical protein
MEISVVYSIGVRCYTEQILKRLNLINFSSIFGSMNIRNYNNLIKCFDTNFNILFDKQNLVYSKNNPNMENDNITHGFRTLNKIFDNINDFHSATIAHHDLLDEDVQQHFLKGIERLHYIKNNNIPILFVNISMEFDNTIYNRLLIDSIIKNGFNNMKIISIYKTDDINFEPKLIHICDNHIIYKIPSYGYNDSRDDSIIKDILLKHYNFDKLLKLEDFSI